ncbi:MAG: hypothetical protein M3362_05270 [Acidobacteriota bacterium]|nr:hypothetical protein [Acidobacteriota bacterium]
MKRRELINLLALLLTGLLSAGCGGGKMPLAGKAEELMNLPTTEKLDSNQKIMGKVAVVEAYPNMPVSLEGFKPDGTIDQLSAFFFAPQRKAQTLDEIDTLVKVACRQGKAIAGSSPISYTSECDVSVIDYKTKTVFAKKSFENSRIPAGGATSNVAPSPSQEIKQYLREFSTYQ